MAKRDTFDAILASVPLNGTAAAVVSQGGDHYDPEVNYASMLHWEAPPPCIKLPTARTFVDLRGVRFGRFTVVGYLGKYNAKKKSLWLVRCACGDYEARHGPAITNPNNANARCRKCLHWATARKRYERDGSRPLSFFTDDSAAAGEDQAEG